MNVRYVWWKDGRKIISIGRKLYIVFRSIDRIIHTSLTWVRRKRLYLCEENKETRKSKDPVGIREKRRKDCERDLR